MTITDGYEPFSAGGGSQISSISEGEPPAGHLCIVWMNVVHAMSTPVTKRPCVTTCCALLFWILSRRRRQTHLYVVDFKGGRPVVLSPHRSVRQSSNQVFSLASNGPCEPSISSTTILI